MELYGGGVYEMTPGGLVIEWIGWGKESLLRYTFWEKNQRASILAFK